MPKDQNFHTDEEIDDYFHRRIRDQPARNRRACQQFFAILAIFFSSSRIDLQKYFASLAY
jgi:hypothetical protein